ncbi:MAG TPA: PIN domain-containing protein [Syntrophorhabdaceae bacterium]|nr:PIN domain-containing protein [Syntrophorhabdaceae bacterium]
MKGNKLVAYLDTSVYNRPFDDQDQVRIKLETEAFLSIIDRTVKGDMEIIGSSVLSYENSRNPFIERRERVSSYFSIAGKWLRLNKAIKERATVLEGAGIDPIDALHLACAESGGAAYFITCDDSVIRKAKQGKCHLVLQVCGPLEFVVKEVFKNA